MPTDRETVLARLAAFETEGERIFPDGPFYRCDEADRQHVVERWQEWRAAREQRSRDRRKAALLLAVIVAWIVVVIAGAGGMDALLAVGLRIVQGLVILAAIWCAWTICLLAHEDGEAGKERGER